MLIDDVALSFIPLKKSDLITLLNRFGSAEKIFSLSHYELTANDGLVDKYADKLLKWRSDCYEKARFQIDYARDMCITIFAYMDDNYPTLLKECVDAPLVLYVMGNSDLVVKDAKWLSVIGTRSCSLFGPKLARDFVLEISQRQKESVIVSSLSYGIESHVHDEALKTGLRTVAILENSLDNIQSATYRDLASKILNSGGTLISEYPLKSTFRSQNYSERNRIVAGISHATIIIEANLNSNTLRTAECTLGYDRPLFAFPGRTSDESYKGSNKLLKSGNAEMITEFRDIEISLNMKKSIDPIDIFKPQLNPMESLIYECLKDGDMHSDEEIMDKTGLSAQQFSSTIMMMFLSDIVVETPGRMYIKK